MAEPELFQNFQYWAHEALLWIGFGTLVGLCAKAVMPGRDPGGAIITLLLGVAGSVIGGGILAFAWQGHRVTPISLIGFFTATLGALVLLIFYRLLAGPWYRRQQRYGDQAPPSVGVPRPYATRRRGVRYEYEE